MKRELVRYPAIIYGVACFVPLLLIFATSGALWPEELPIGATSRRQVIGMSLMLILMPPFLISAAIGVQRHSILLVDLLRQDLPDPSDADDAKERMRNALRRSWVIGGLGGLAAGLFNAPLHYALFVSTTPAIDVVSAFGQVFLWLIIGLLIGMRTVTAQCFNQLGAVIRFDLFQLERLRPLARSGLNDVLVTVMAFSLSPLQSLDAEFRWYNYAFAIVVAVPAALTLLFLPLRAVHRRIVREKSRRLDDVESKISDAVRSGASEDLVRFETLLAHRERLSNQSTWPLRTALISRLIFYLVIPPLAWVGAAIVERMVTQALTD